jgi:uncharacterized protein
MPANLTPQYMAAEERFRQAITLEDKLGALREMLAVVPKHKGTEKLQAELKRKLSKLQEEQEQHHRSAGRRHDPGHVPRVGAGQIALLGPPNSGKSSLLAALTHAHPEIAEYPFTTLMPLPGMMPFEDVQVQLVDTPPFAGEPFDPVLVSVARGADALALVFDPHHRNLGVQCEQAVRLLARSRIIVRGRPVPEELTLAGKVEPVIVLYNKVDLGQAETDLAREILGHDLEAFVIAAARGIGLEQLRAVLWDLLGVVRCYSKEPGKKPDSSRPFVLKRGATVMDMAQIIHKDLAAHFRFARVWGSARFDGLPVERDHVLVDRDVVEIHT